MDLEGCNSVRGATFWCWEPVFRAHTVHVDTAIKWSQKVYEVAPRTMQHEDFWEWSLYQQNTLGSLYFTEHTRHCFLRRKEEFQGIILNSCWELHSKQTKHALTSQPVNKISFSTRKLMKMIPIDQLEPITGAEAPLWTDISFLFSMGHVHTDLKQVGKILD